MVSVKTNIVHLLLIGLKHLLDSNDSIITDNIYIQTDKIL